MADNLHRNQPKSFSDINIGDNVEFEIFISEALHQNFSELSGDFSPIHCDEEYCQQTKFKNKIGYAFMLTSFLSRLYGEYLPGGSSICIKQDSKFLKPFYIGDTIKIYAEVVEKSESTKFIEIKSKICRDNGECVFKGIGIVQIISQ